MKRGASAYYRQEKAKAITSVTSLPQNYTEMGIVKKSLILMFLLLSWGLQSQDIYLGSDPLGTAACHCLDNATTLSDGQFLDTITVNSGIPGETWTVTSNTGALDFSSPPPPSPSIPLANGSTLTEVSTGVYEIIIKHQDAIGFQISVSNGGTTLNIDNRCYYPDISFVGLPDTICLTSALLALQADANGSSGTGFFTINGQPATELNAQTLGIGLHQVSYTFDAGTATPDDPGDPGCSSTISKEVRVPFQPTIAVVALVNVTLGSDCVATITPEMVMAGEYPCMDDFLITVFDQNGLPIGNMVNGSHAGERLNVMVMSEAGSFIGDGQIDIFDTEAPLISCPPGDNMPAYTNEVQFINGSITNADPDFSPNNFSCYNSSVAPMSGSHRYNLLQFTVTATDFYTIELNVDVPGGGVFGLYQGEFDPFQGPCQGITGIGEPLPSNEGYYTNIDGITRLHVMLMPGMPYTLLTTTYEGNETGSFQYALYSVEDGLIANLPSIDTDIHLPLYCSSISNLINNPASVELLGAPVIDDACMLNPELEFTDVFTNAGNCGISTIERTFTVTDGSGNANQCTQTISFPPISISEVNLPPQTVTISCSSTFETNENGNPHPSETGFPFIITAEGVFNIDQAYCNMLASYEDRPRVMVCTGTDQFVRQWIIFDDCDPSSLVEFDQFIIIGDMTGPTITCSAPDLDLNGLPDTLTYGTQGAACSAIIEVPLPIVTDDCSGWTVSTEVVIYEQVAITNPFGQIIGFETEVSVHSTIPPNGSRIVSNIPIGQHLFRYTATDDCGNTSSTSCPFRVDDYSLPTAACDDLIHVSLGGNGIGYISANDIDEGSNDNCGPVMLDIRRTIDFLPDDCSPAPPIITSWGPTVDLFCCEAGDTISVSLRVTDLSGNINICDALVAIDDTTPPGCLPPPPINTDCTNIPAGEDFNDISSLQTLFGMASVIDQCADATIVELAPIVDLGSCGLGTITRTFQASDPAGNTNSCQQLITFSLATSYAIKFPRDVIGDCIDPGADTLAINNYGCDQFAVNTFDEEYDVTDGACFKILRTYSVINWCEYDGFSDAVELDRNAGCLEESGSQDLWVIRAANGTSYLDADDDQNNNIPAAGTRSVSCDGLTNPAGYWSNVQSNGRWSYTQVIKVINTTDPVVTVEPYNTFCVNPNTCEAPVSLDFSISGVCAAATAGVSIAIDISTTGQFITSTGLSGSFPNFQYNGTLPIGNHRLRVDVDDDCSGNVATFIDFQVVDCNAAGLVCNNAISLSLMQQPDGVDADGDGDFDMGAAAVNVNLFVNATGADCSGPLSFTIHRVSDIIDGSDIPFPNHPALVVTCDDIGFIPVIVYVWDSAFNPAAIQPDGTLGGPNYTTCDAFLQVLDENNVCNPAPGMGSISGLIITEEGLPVEGIEVSPRDDMPEDMMMTESDGLYHFDLETEQAYQVTPYSPDDYLNGVSTLDLILISKHILGVDPIDSPYKIIAADINHSNTVSTLDLVHLRKAILGITTAFPNNESWRFINDAFEFPDPLDPWLEPFPETVVVPMLMNPMNSADFIAVKIGDINGSVQASLMDQGEGRASGDTYYLRTEETDFTKGETLEATFTAADEMDEIQGFQFTLQFDPTVLAIEEIEWGEIEEEHINTAWMEQGLIAISWDAKSQFSALNFFTIRFEAINDGRLSESIGITSRLLNAEAYALDDSRREMALNFTPKATVADNFFLEQNKPNPFGDQTIIGFQIPKSGQVTLTIYDTHGKVVRQYQKYYAAGYNQLMVDAQDISARGLLYYKLETDQYAATKKMVILDN